MGNRESSGRTGSSPSVSFSGEFAHPGSPLGGGGPGGFVTPTPLGAEDGRPDILAFAQTPRPVVFAEFNNKGRGKYVDAIKSNPMGVHPPGNFSFVNAVELIFKVDEKLAKKMGIWYYRCKQRVHTQEVWEREFKDGQLTPWSRTMSGGAEPDDPAEGLQKTTPPILAFHDAPGFMATVNDAQLEGPNRKKTSKTAVAVFLRQNFIAWIEGAPGSGKHMTWQPVSDEVKWHSTQSIVANLVGKARWVAVAAGSEIELGHTQGKPK